MPLKRLISTTHSWPPTPCPRHVPHTGAKTPPNVRPGLFQDQASAQPSFFFHPRISSEAASPAATTVNFGCPEIFYEDLHTLGSSTKILDTFRSSRAPPARSRTDTSPAPAAKEPLSSRVPLPPGSQSRAAQDRPSGTDLKVTFLFTMSNTTGDNPTPTPIPRRRNGLTARLSFPFRQPESRDQRPEIRCRRPEIRISFLSSGLCPLVSVACLVEVNGIEPMTSCLQSRRSPN